MTIDLHNKRRFNDITKRLLFPTGYDRWKRILDIGFSFLGLIGLSPVFLLLAVGIKLFNGGPVLFWQMRVGKEGKPFWLPKFRTMVNNAEDLKTSLMRFNERKDGIAFKMRRDPRVTRFGRFLRTYSLDELPQLWNVWKGEMSLVGPRPAIPEEVRLYSGEEKKRLSVKPGLTCLWQISGRGDLSFKHQVALDLAYIEQRGVLMDLWILWKTIPAVLLGKGAY